MKRVKLFLENWGLHAFLLPVFFIVHNYIQYYGLVRRSVAFNLLLEIIAFLLIFFLLLLAVTKHVNKSLQLTTLAGFTFLFFGVIKDFWGQTLHLYFLSKYSILLPFLLIIIVLLARIILKKKNFRTANLFQNLLLCIFLLIDGGYLIFFDSAAFRHKNLLVKEYDSLLQPAPATTNKPDVYYLVFDTYPGTRFLYDYMHFDNSSLDTSLQQKGFRVVQNSKSNYNRTAFSIAATLNFQYLQGIQNFSTLTSKQYNQALLTIKEANVVKLFQRNNYQFYNLSIFHIADNPPIYREHFLSLPEKNVLLYNSLVERIKKDVLWNFLVEKNSNRIVNNFFKTDKNSIVAEQVKKRAFNNVVIDSLLKILLTKSVLPKFVYAHLYLPHPPYFFNEKGKSNDVNYVTDARSFSNRQLFLSYLRYTNTVILTICSRIIQASGNNAVIVLESDHGFTDFEARPKETALYFKNYTAFYFPDKNYTAISDTMSNINTFPILFNQYFHTTLSLQKDSSFFLPD